VGQQEIVKQYIKNITANLRDNVLYEYAHADLECVANGPTADTVQNPVTVFAISLPVFSLPTKYQLTGFTYIRFI
jgi:hypothetical protein